MATPRRYRVLVLGAGIVGLSSALRIQESCSNVDVTVMADKFSPDTCSDCAAGFWEAFAMSNTDQELVNSLTNETYDYMMGLATSPLAKVTATQRISGYQLWGEIQKKELMLMNTVDGYRRMTDKELSRHPGAKDGRFFTSLIMDVTDHLKYLTHKLKAKGMRFIQRRLKTKREFEELCNDWDVVVNCMGTGSYQLIEDDKVYPIRGQVFRVNAPWIKHFYLDLSMDGGKPPVYIFPNNDKVVVGGTFQERNWNEGVDKTDSQMIWENAVKMLPALKEATILNQRVGLRPARSALRLETEVIEIGADKKLLRVVHNYGHGGAGIALHWGCAGRSADMVSQFIRDIDTTTNIKLVNSTRSKL